ncbi:MAG: ATP phosphoribosyltransferase regulatory subunit [Clostridiales bacterium]|nr:ATP phosphoribosyltransferase regulatory subunit [Clostridiales bacterium]
MTENKLKELFELYGFRKFKMSRFETYDFYSENRSFLKTSNLITFTDLDGRLMAMKPDITLSIMRNAGSEDEKVYYMDTVYRASGSHFREVAQAGVERIGYIDDYAEAEVIALAAKALQSISEDYSLRISDSDFVSTLLEELKTDEATQKEILSLFSRKNCDGIKKLQEENRIDEKTYSVLVDVLGIYMPLKQGIEKIREKAFGEKTKKTIEHLSSVCEILDSFKVLDRVYLDFSMAAGMSYYSGVIFRGAVPSIPMNILSGGRYDTLPRKMGKQSGAIGFAIDLDLIDSYIKTEKEYDYDAVIVYTNKTDKKELAKLQTDFVEKGKSVFCICEGSYEKTKERIIAKETICL